MLRPGRTRRPSELPEPLVPFFLVYLAAVGGALVVWDRLFGTFEPEAEAPVYGITEPLRSVNPLWMQAHEYVDIARDVWRAHGWRDRLGYLFHGPGRAPGASR